MVIRGNELANETVLEIGRFAILWNCLERSIFDNNCSIPKIKERYKNIYINEEAQKRLAEVLNVRRGWFRQVIPEYVETGLYPGNAHRGNEDDSMLIQKFMKQEDEDLRCGCLLTIYRLRNNLMHGLKLIEELNGQLELFKAVNEVLESIRED